MAHLLASPQPPQCSTRTRTPMDVLLLSQPVLWPRPLWPPSGTSLTSSLPSLQCRARHIVRWTPGKPRVLPSLCRSYVRTPMPHLWGPARGPSPDVSVCTPSFPAVNPLMWPPSSLYLSPRLLLQTALLEMSPSQPLLQPLPPTFQGQIQRQSSTDLSLSAQVLSFALTFQSTCDLNAAPQAGAPRGKEGATEDTVLASPSPVPK